ncbi:MULTISPECIES: hypothetical protein [Brevibacillus]|uniref:hypothetical protein n=1 Tax=Brevibacillus TaxID=55080 RepID=UPI0011444E9A|nr:hypothetical protein [Brevibacillus borstelensis]MBE5397384.1 hypothetical protein [Brevibacillus borstelensis]MCC0562962.1 hypothetical protein [Brevibacillus borstelensis]MCM3470411.1 hypothetical protein [Brevibacillus borstelensis]MCM3557230.1 hypothetical protein [Brevibacillus borstelensis]MCM3590780.1 hypothetical protein [Brevibacillus borstelensis]
MKRSTPEHPNRRSPSESALRSACDFLIHHVFPRVNRQAGQKVRSGASSDTSIPGRSMAYEDSSRPKRNDHPD